MFEIEQQNINNFKKNKKMYDIVFVVLKLLMAYALIIYVEYGLILVIGYILYSIESSMSLYKLNVEEIQLQMNVLQHKIDNIESKKTPDENENI